MHEDIPDSFMEGYDVSFCSSHLSWQLGSHILYITAEKMPFQGTAFLAHTKQKVGNIVDLTVLRLAIFMGYG